MSEIISKLKTPEECTILEKNAVAGGRVDLAVAARKRALELKAQQFGSTSDIEKECLKAIYAYEKILTEKNGRNTRASRTWQMIERHGIIGCVERSVNREVDAAGYTALLKMGLEDFAFESVVVRNPEVFSEQAVQHAMDRLEKVKNGQ